MKAGEIRKFSKGEGCDFSFAEDRLFTDPLKVPLAEIAAWGAAHGIVMRAEVAGSDVTTLRIGGSLALVAEVRDVAQLRLLLAEAQRCGLKPHILGNGSNLLIPDEGVRGLVIRLHGELNGWSADGAGAGRFIVGAGSSLMTLCRALGDGGWSGIEFAAGIPASIGGAAVMNAGAHGGEMSSIIRALTLVLKGGELVQVQRSEIPFQYRTAGLPPSAVVASVELELASGDRDAIRSARARYLEYRKRTQPLTLPSAGSIFRNPAADLPAGLVLEQCGAKGLSCGGVEVSTLHANWIVNPRRTGRAVDVDELIRRCRELVQKRRGIDLHPELVRW